MVLTRRLVLAGTFGALARSAHAQSATIVRLRGTIATVTADNLTVKLRSGEQKTLKLSDKLGLTWILPTPIETIKPGTYIGTAAIRQPDGSLKALEIQVFPEAMRGIGEGHRPWDFGAQSSMTNGTVGDVTVTDGRMLHLKYKDGEQVVFVPPNAPIITYEPATIAALTPGAHVIVFAEEAPDGGLTAQRIGVGKDGLVPPM